MSSVIVTVADTVQTLLQAESDAGGFIRTFEARRRYSVMDKLEDMGVLHVDIVHLANEISRVDFSRRSILWTVPVHIGIRKRFDDSERDFSSGDISTTEIDEMVELTEQIAEFFDRTHSANGVQSSGSSAIVSIAPDSLSSGEVTLRTHQMFLGIVRATFRYDKTIA